jgi:lipoate-protein ligase A
MEARGFTPIVRPVGGHLAAYGPGSLVVHLWGPHPEARSDIKARFRLAGEALASPHGSLGVDARVGAVPGEYCDGEFSVNAAGRVKLVGTGQRIVRTGFLLSAVVMVASSEPERDALVEAYAALGLDLEPSTVGCVADVAPGVTLADARGAVTDALSRLTV